MIQETQQEIYARAWYKEFCRINGKPYNFKENQVAAKEYWTLLAARNSLIQLPDMSKVNIPPASPYVEPIQVAVIDQPVVSTNEQPQVVAEVVQPSDEFVLGTAITFDAIDRKNYGDAIVDAAKVETPVPTVEVIETPIPSIEPIPVKPVEVAPTIDPIFTDTSVITGQYQKVDTKKNKNVFYAIAVVIAIVAFFYFK